MPVIAEIKEQLLELSTFKDISTAFTEASAAKIKKIRQQFEVNKNFYEEISYVYHLVLINAKKQQQKPKIAVPAPKIICVALTSNMRFYGVINIDIIKLFLLESEKLQSDRMVIGSTGTEYMKATRFDRPYQTMTFNKDNPDSSEINSFLESVKTYDKVYLFYPKFESLLFQSVGTTDITLTEVSKKVAPEDELHIIFEPELSKILAFFQSQVRMLLFQRVMLETDLARTSARLLTMSAAEERTDTLIKEQKTNLRKMVRSFVNAQLLETFAGMKKWGK